MLDVRPDILEAVRSILKVHMPRAEVWAFGSRVTGNAESHSDLDLVAITDGKIPRRSLRLLQEAFAESSIPIRIDLVDWHRITPEFRAVIEQRNVVVQAREC